MSRASGSFWIISKKCNICAIEVLKECESVVQKKYLKRKMTESSPNLMKDQLINPTNSVNLKKDKLKETHPQIYHKLLKTREKEKKILKAVREKWCITREQWSEWLRGNREAQKAVEQHFIVLKLEFCIWQNILQECRWNRDSLS